MKCEICNKPAEIDFNCWLPSFGFMVSGIVCISCISAEEHDLAVAVKLIALRAKARNIPTPVTPDVLEKLAQPEGEPNGQRTG